MTPSPVPPAYVGVWRRTLLKTPTLRDTTTRVFWLQTDVWHADIRIPANRPELSGDTLACLDRSAMRALAQQQGFAGITEVSGDVCRWHRKIDYQPPGRFNDVGRMRFDTPDRLFEYGVEQDYFEIWERVDGSGGDNAVLELNTPSQPRSLLLRAGEFVMLVRDRNTPLVAADHLETLIDAMSDDELISSLDLEISFGWRVDSASWRVELSTLPWREDQVIAFQD